MCVCVLICLFVCFMAERADRKGERVLTPQEGGNLGGKFGGSSFALLL